MRGESKFVTMKGFLGDLAVKGDGHEVETVPAPEGADITESAELDNAMPTPADKGSNIKPGENKTGAPSTTMSPELEEVAEKAEEDIADGYVSDPQHHPGPGDREVKGYEAFNDMVTKGAVCITKAINKYDIQGSMDLIEKSANLSFNSFADENVSPWMTLENGFDDGMTVFKSPTYAEIVAKGDTEDMGLEDGYVDEAPENPTMEQASDDTQPEQGENDSTPQTEEAKREDEDQSNAETGEVGEAEKGWAGFDRMVAKGFVADIEEKGKKEIMEAGKKLWRKYNPVALTRRGGAALHKSGAKGRRAADKVGLEADLRTRKFDLSKPGKTGESAGYTPLKKSRKEEIGGVIARNPGKILGGAAAAGALGAGGTYAATRKKEYDSPMVEKAYGRKNAPQRKGATGKPKASDLRKRTFSVPKDTLRETLTKFAKSGKGKAAIAGAGALAAGGAGYGVYRALRGKKKK